MTYTSYAQLAAEQTPGVDYRIRAYNRFSSVVVIAPHGGGVETGTSELARAVAGEEMDGPKWSEYRFEGLKSSGNSALHITSTYFDEPACLWLLSQSSRAVTLHGTTGTNPEVYVGGLDGLVRDRVVEELTAAGFVAEVSSGDIAGVEPANITNRGTSGVGVQLELSTALRAAMFGTNTAAGRWGTRNDVFYDFVRGVRTAVAVDVLALG
jgi:phage replication-related protein YjqB (UPF0714/DUF867 family)